MHSDLNARFRLGTGRMTERPDAVLWIGKWRVHLDTGELSQDGRRTKLDPRAMRILMYLAERPGQVVGVKELLDGVWGRAIVTPHSVYEAIAALRQALEDPSDKPEYVVTLPRRGYRLIAPVETDSPPAEVPTATPVTVEAASDVVMTAAPRRRTEVALVAAACAIGAIGLIAWLSRSVHAPSERVTVEKSIAVLPFLDLSENKDEEYFADGLAEELLEVLANVPSLRVIGRTSSFQFKNKNEDVRDIGAKLGASYVVEGSVRRVGDHVRVAAQLIRTADGSHQWSETYDRSVNDTLKMESDLATSIGRALELSVASNVGSKSIDTSSPEANDHYLRGLHALDTYTRVGTEEAANQFQAAIALDSNFTAAYTSLGRAQYIDAAFGFVTPEAGFPQVRESALTALKIDPQSAMAHALLARVATLYTWDWQEAQRESDAALVLGPQNPIALFAAGDLATVLGDFARSERLFRASLVSDPLNPETLFMLGISLRATGRLEEAEAAARRCLAISPTYVYAHAFLGNVLMAQGRPEEALGECKHDVHDGDQATCLAKAHYLLGHVKEADAALGMAVREHSHDRAFLIAALYAERGEKDRAFEWLDRAYRQKDPVLEYIKSTPEFDGLRGDARYDTLLDKMHLPD